jgi:CRP/FNR family transcriptional regulator
MATDAHRTSSPDLPSALPAPDISQVPNAIMPVCAACEIRQFTFCSALQDEELGHLQAIVRQVRMAPQQLLFQEGDDAGNVYNILGGILKLYKLLPDGRRQITGFVHPGDFIGIAASGIYSYSAEAITDVALCRFPRRQLYLLFDRFPKLEGRLLGITTDELTAAQDQMLLLGRKTAAEKLASFLLSLGTRMNGEGGEEKPIPVPMTRSDVADYLGLTVETVSRTLSRLKKSGLIEISEAHRITITQLDALQDIAEGL